MFHAEESTLNENRRQSPLITDKQQGDLHNFRVKRKWAQIEDGKRRLKQEANK